MSDNDIRQERDELHQALIEIAEKVAPFTDRNLDEHCDVDHIVRAVDSLVRNHDHWKARANRLDGLLRGGGRGE